MTEILGSPTSEVNGEDKRKKGPRLDMLENHEKLVASWEEVIQLSSQLNEDKRKGELGLTILRKVEGLVESEGIPQQYRGKIWIAMSGANIFKKKNPGLFEKLLEEVDQEQKGNIEMDTKRLRLNSYFEAHLEDSSIEAIQNILFAWCSYDPDIGYVQGMAYIATLIYVTVVLNSMVEHDEEDAFCLFTSIMISYGFKNLCEFYRSLFLYSSYPNFFFLK